MLFRKMLREIKNDFGQFFSIFLMAVLAVAVYVMMNGDAVGGRKALNQFCKDTDFAEAMVYSESFTQENLDAVRALDSVKAAQLRLHLTGSTPDYNDAQTEIYLEKENLVTRPLSMEGQDFDPADPKGIWVNTKFAEVHGISLGDDLTIAYGDFTITRQVKGLIVTPEHVYMCADTDADTNFENIAYVYLSLDGLVQELDEKMDDLLAAAGLKSTAQFLPLTQMLIIFSDDKKPLAHEDAIAKALDNNYSVMIDRTMLESYERYDSELKQHKTFAYAFAMIFVVLVIMIISTTMKRMIDKQRTEIGTMNAMGLSMGKILWHYVSFSLWVSVLGAAVGFLVGIPGAKWILGIFGKWYILPDLKFVVDISFFGVCLAVVAICVASAWLSCRRLVHIRPAQALRPAAPKAAKRTLLERFAFWNRLGFTAQYNLRSAARSKLRIFMGILGTGAAMMLIVFSFGCNSLLDQGVNWIFGKIQNFKYEAALNEGADLEKVDALCDKVDGEMVMTAAIELSAVKKKAATDDKVTRILTVLEGKGLYNITDPETRVVPLEEGDVALSHRLANDLGVKKGDTIYWHLYEKNAWYASKVTLISRAPQTGGITMLRSDYEKLGADYTPTLLVSDQDLSAYKNEEEVRAVHGMEEIKKAFIDNMAMFSALVAFMIIFSVILTIAVLYSSANITFNERLREYATLKVMGLSTQQIRRIINKENFCVTLIGILVGSPFAMPFLIWMTNTNGEIFDYYLKIPTYAYFISGIFILAVAMLTGLLFSRRIRKLDMVGSLKGAE